MRLTWLVLGVVVAAGAVAFINTDDEPEGLPSPKADKPALNRKADAPKAGPGFDLTRCLLYTSPSPRDS